MNMDWEVVIKFYDVDSNHATVSVSKDGGGSMGRSYYGDWTVKVNGVYGETGEWKFSSGTKKNHYQVAGEVYDFYLADFE